MLIMKKSTEAVSLTWKIGGSLAEE